MTEIENLLAADEARREAMIGADEAAMKISFHENLKWTHSSGKTDDRQALMDTICSGSVVYHSIENEDVEVSQHGDMFIMSGVLKADVTKEGQPKVLANKFLSVWEKTPAGIQMLAWQSTGLAG